MSDRRQDDMAAQAWPGFVDILSSTVIMFVFFVMVIVVVLFLYTIKYTATVEKVAEEKVKRETQTEKSESLGDLEELKNVTAKEIADLQLIKSEIIAEIEQLSSGLQGSGNQTVMINGNELIILFEDNAITLTEETIAELNAFMEGHRSGVQMSIRAGDDPLALTPSSSRRLNLSRMMNVRNVLIKRDNPPERVSLNYSEAEKIGDYYGWIKVSLE